MHELTYISSSGAQIELLSDDVVATTLPLRFNDWSYKLGDHSLLSVSRKAKAIDIDIVSVHPQQADSMQSAFDYDVRNSLPGLLVVPDGWSQRAFIVGSKTKSRIYDTYTATLTVALLDGVWRKITKHELLPKTGDIETENGLNYPHDFPFDYAYTQIGKDITFNDDSLVRLTFWGPCISPYLRIGDNTYGVVGLEVPAGSRLVIDPTKINELGESIKLIGEFGSAKNVFHTRLRGAQNSGSYVFERVKRGTQIVAWPQSFGVTVEEIEERGEPPWSL